MKKKKICLIAVVIVALYGMDLISDFTGKRFTRFAMAAGSTVNVGPGRAYSSIQNAIDSVSAGDTVYVHDGTYFENINIYKSITLQGESMNGAIIDGGLNDVVVSISADGVIFSGFSVKNSGEDLSGIRLNGVTGCTVDNNNIFENSLYGIEINDSSDTYIAGNIITTNDFGVCIVKSSDNTINDNTISSNKEEGIRLSVSTGNAVTNNEITSNKGDGLWMAYSSNNSFTGNNITGSSREGVKVYHCSKNTFDGNNIAFNARDGIWHLGSTETTIINNVFQSDGILIYDNEVQYWNTHTIENNTANGRPVRFYKNSVDNTVPQNTGQVILANCTGCTIENLDITDVDTAIQLGFCNNSIVRGNHTDNNSQDGIRVAYSTNIKVEDNIFHFDGITLWGAKIFHFNTHTIENNTTNGRPLRYYKNSDNITVPSDTAQVILANCSGCNIENLDVSDGDTGIQLAYSDNNTVTGNTALRNSRDGIWLSFSSNNVITNNIASNNEWDGIRIKFFCSNNTVTGNIFEENVEYGIELYKSDNNYLANNKTASNF